MKIRNFVFILIGIMLVGFGVGFYSLIYNDNFSFSSFRNFDIGNIDVNTGDSLVKVGIDGVEVRDGDSHVIVGWDGIKVVDVENKVIVGPGEIGIEDGRNSSGWGWNWFGNSKLSSITLDEEKFESIIGIEDISVSSPFVDIDLTLEDREDVRIKYSGRLRANVTPELEVDKNGSKLDIRLVIDGFSYSVTDSTVKLQIFIPNNFEGNYQITSSSGDISSDKLIGKEIQISTSSGDMILGEIGANNVSLTSSSGNIKTNAIHGDLQTNTSSGDVYFKLDSSTGNININTSSGDVRLEDVSGNSYSGEINTSSGDFQYSGDISVTKNNRDNYKIKIGSGEKLMEINTSSGDIEFR